MKRLLEVENEIKYLSALIQRKPRFGTTQIAPLKEHAIFVNLNDSQKLSNKRKRTNNPYLLLNNQEITDSSIMKPGNKVDKYIYIDNMGEIILTNNLLDGIKCSNDIKINPTDIKQSIKNQIKEEKNQEDIYKNLYELMEKKDELMEKKDELMEKKDKLMEKKDELNGKFVEVAIKITDTSKNENVKWEKALISFDPADKVYEFRLYYEDGAKSEYITIDTKKKETKKKRNKTKPPPVFTKVNTEEELDIKDKTKKYYIDNIDKKITDDDIKELNKLYGFVMNFQILKIVSGLFKKYQVLTDDIPLLSKSPVMLDNQGEDVKNNTTPLTININVNDLAKSAGLNSKLEDQLKFYILYTMTYILDILHDFVKVSKNILEQYIKFYKERILYVINTLYPTNQQTLDTLLDFICNLFDYTDQRIIENQQKLLVQAQYENPGTSDKIRIILSNEFNITQIFESDALKKLNGQEELQEVMESILDYIHLPPTDISDIADSLDEAVKINSDKNDNLPIFIGHDVVVSSKSSYLRKLMKKYYNTTKTDQLYFFNSIADKFDRSGKKAEVINHLRYYTLTGDLHVTEQFTFGRHPPIDIIKYSILDYNRPSATITKFMDTSMNLTFNDSSISSVTKIINNNITNAWYVLFKTIGDKAKRDILYGVKNSQVVTLDSIPLIIFSANDILSSMTASILLPGSVISGKSVMRNKNPTSVFSDQEYLAKRDYSRRMQEFGKRSLQKEIHKLEKEIKYLGKSNGR
jgi:hypothetical protein